MKLRNCIVKILVWVLCIIIVLELLWCFVVPKVLNKYFSNENIIVFLAKKDIQANIAPINYTALSDFTLFVQTKTLNIRQHSSEILNSNNLNLKIKIIPLLINKLYVDTFSVDDLLINVTRRADGNFNISNVLSDAVILKIVSLLETIKLDINSYEININDELAAAKIKLSGDYVVLKDFTKNKKIELNVVGELFSNNKRSKFLVDLTTNFPIKKSMTRRNFNINLFAENIDLSIFAPIIKQITHSKVEKVDGIITANIKTENNLNKKQIVGKIITKNIEIREKLEENSFFLKEKANIDFVSNLFSQNIEIEKLSIKTLYHNIKLTGLLAGVLTNKPNIDLNLELYNNANSMIYNAIPSEISFENGMIAKIKKYKPKATLFCFLRIKGSPLKPDLWGNIEIEDLFLDLPVARNAKAKLNLIFDKDHINTLAKVSMAKNEFVDVSGKIELYNRQRATFEITTTKNIKLDEVKAVILPLQDVFSLNLGILNQILLEKGYGSANLQIEGTRKEPIVNGVLDFRDVTAAIEGINATLEKVNGFVNFKGKFFEFATKKALLDGDDLKLDLASNFDGKYKINVSSNKIKTSKIINIIETSPVLSLINKDFAELSCIKSIIGNSKIDFNLIGQYDIENNDFNIEKSKYNALLQLKNNTLCLQNILVPIKLKTANISYDNKTVNLVSNLEVLNSQLNIDANAVSDKVKIYANSKKFLLKDIVKLADKKELYSKFLSGNKLNNSAAVKFSVNYSGERNKLDFQKLRINAILLSSAFSTEKKKAVVANGSVSLQNGDLFIDNICFSVLDSIIAVNGKISHLFANKPDYNLMFDLKNFNLEVLNGVDIGNFFNKDLAKIIDAYEQYKGIISGYLNLDKNGINGKLITSDIEFMHKHMQMPISISNTEFVFRNDTISIPALHSTIDDIPVYITAEISNILKKTKFKGYLTSNLYPNFINKYINANLGYPIKLKGETAVKVSFDGFVDALRINTIVKIPIGSDVSYMGANLKEEDFERELKADLFITENKVKILDETYSKYVPSLNGIKAKYPYISVSGSILRNQFPCFENLRIKTFAPTNSEIFNILFKKSIIKSGTLECDLTANGNLESLKVLGFAKLKDINMPLYKTFVKDIYADLKKDNIEIKTSAEVLNTNISAIAVLANRFNPPFKIKKAEIYADYLNLNKILDFLSAISMKKPISPQFDINMGMDGVINPADIVINNTKIFAKEILIKEYPATDLVLQIHKNTDGILKIDDLDFKIANGTINANGFYNFNTGALQGNCIAKSIDANQFSDLFINVRNQIYGELDGVVNISTKGADATERIKNTNGKISFQIIDGKMPKLGSLEYLLRAGNIVKSGITGFTMNSIIELLVPINTGEFSAINGDITLENGNAQDIKIYSKGKNLSLYLTGSTNILENNADMVVYGRLSKKVSTLLGPIGNTSLNTLFNLIPGVKLSDNDINTLDEINKIPGLELFSDDFRFFKAIISGNLNTENYVQSFRWVE